MILGIDEVGMGCIAGDVVVCGFLTKNEEELSKINLLYDKKIIKDSKKLSDKLLKLAEQQLIQTNCKYYFSSRTAQEIDKFGINNCWQFCINEIVSFVDFHLNCNNYSIIVDGNRLTEGLKKRSTAKAIIKADSLYPHVMAASILAKVKRDEDMIKLSKIYPGYDFEHNVGYASNKHINAIKEIGKCFIHRKSFKIKGVDINV